MSRVLEAIDRTLAAKLAERYEREGYVIAPPVIPAELLARVDAAFDEVMAGRYETGLAPLDHWWKPGDDPGKKLRKIDQPHLANRAIADLITYPALGQWVAAITGAHMVQAWVVQLLHKPSGGDAQGAVGWHQDYQYWQNWWTPDSNVFTAWLAVSDVTLESGPMCFVPESQKWGFLNAGDFFGSVDVNEHSIKIPDGARWEEVPDILPPGAFSLHHRLTYHGSYPNTSGRPRRGFAIHLRTERSTPTPGQGLNPTDAHTYDYVSHLADPQHCPVLYRAEE